MNERSSDADRLAATSHTRSWVTFLRHPLVVGAGIALISGVLASLLIPALTRVWQDRPRELALKRDLVERISSAGTSAVGRGATYAFIVETRNPSRTKRIAFLIPAVRKWSVDGGVIEAELTTYFQATALPRQWRTYEVAVEDFLRYISRAEVGTHAFLLRDLRDHFRAVRFDDGNADRERRSWTHGESLQGSRIELTRLLLAEQDQITRRIVASNASGFSHGVWFFQ
jgi:hypothetical protein